MEPWSSVLELDGGINANLKMEQITNQIKTVAISGMRQREGTPAN